MNHSLVKKRFIARGLKTKNASPVSASKRGSPSSVSAHPPFPAPGWGGSPRLPRRLLAEGARPGRQQPRCRGAGSPALRPARHGTARHGPPTVPVPSRLPARPSPLARCCPTTAPAPLSTAPALIALGVQLTARQVLNRHFYCTGEPGAEHACERERKGRQARAVCHLPWPLGGRLGRRAAPGGGLG